MDSKPLLFGLIGFFLGGLIVSVAATTFDKPAGASMSEMTTQLEEKTGDDFDEAYIVNMIKHHESAVEMSRLSEDRAKHDEVKQLSRDIIANQQSEIDTLKQWQAEWGYEASNGHEGSTH